MQPLCRLLPFQVAEGAVNMAADETLLESALAGAASLRLYAWTVPTVSLGYFQPAGVWRDDPRLGSLPMVRRPSGGETLVHDREVTYCLALPAGPPWQDRRSWADRMHEVILAALGTLNVAGRKALEEQPGPSSLCFQHPTPGDILAGQPGTIAKVVGSAQRKRRGAILQHGAVLLAASRWTPQLPGIRELTGIELSPHAVCRALRQEFAACTGWTLVSQEWTSEERRRIEELADSRYAQQSWNEKR